MAVLIAGLLPLSAAAQQDVRGVERRAPPELSISKRASGPYRVGQLETFTIVVRNGGPGSAGPGVKVIDAVPTEFTGPITVQAPGWTCTIGGSLVTCLYAGSAVPAGGAFPPIVIRARAAVRGLYQNCASLPPSIDFSPGDNQACIQGKLQGAAVYREDGRPR